MDHPKALKKLLRLAVVALPAFAAGAAGYKAPVACIDTTDSRRSEISSATLLPQEVEDFCCGTYEYYAIGGNKKNAHNNAGACGYSVEGIAKYAGKVHASYCDTACPGPKQDYAPENGLCGGGGICDGTDPNACGRYRSVYKCGAAPDVPAQTPAPTQPAAAVGSAKKTPVACVEVPRTTATNKGTVTTTPEEGEEFCCNHENGYTHYAIGGHWWTSHSNGLLCSHGLSDRIQGYTRTVATSLCDSPCPGPNKDYHPANGLCGGGRSCEGNWWEWDCKEYRSVYKCGADEPSPPPPPPPSPEAPPSRKKRSTVQTPSHSVYSAGLVACVKVPNKRGYITKDAQSVLQARHHCCKPGSSPFFTLGGRRDDYDNRGIACEDLRDHKDSSVVELSECNAPCKGYSSDYSLAYNGICGGGESDFRAVYSCDAGVTPQDVKDLSPYPMVGPIACVTKAELFEARGAYGISEQYGRAVCCDGPDAKKYFLLGGHYGEGRRNGLVCTDDLEAVLPGRDGKVDMGKCAVACPGPDFARDPNKWGMCGGGGEEACTLDTEECGSQRSVYACDTSVTSVNLKAGSGGKLPDAGAPQAPIGCALMKNVAAPFGSGEPSEQTGRAKCCGTGENKKYFAMGGHQGKFEDDKLWAPGFRGVYFGDRILHNGIQCADSIDEFFKDPEDGMLDDRSLCDVGCSGPQFTGNSTHWGFCGGDNKQCTDTAEPYKCGIYRSIYAC